MNRMLCMCTFGSTTTTTTAAAVTSKEKRRARFASHHGAADASTAGVDSGTGTGAGSGTSVAAVGRRGGERASDSGAHSPSRLALIDPSTCVYACAQRKTDRQQTDGNSEKC